jgi:hypothetical protein
MIAVHACPPDARWLSLHVCVPSLAARCATGGVMRTTASGSSGQIQRQCCVGRSACMTERTDEKDRLSDGRREPVECCADPVAGGDVGGEFVVATAEVLDEGMPCGQSPRRTVALQAAHRPRGRRTAGPRPGHAAGTAARQ